MNNLFWRTKKVLITGHEGFLGSWLAKKLIQSGADVVGVDKMINRKVSLLNGVRNKVVSLKGDIADYSLVKTIIEEYKPKVIFHVAAEAIVGECNRNPVRCFKSNIQGTWNILEIARDKKYIEAIVTASSDKAYGSHKKLPYKEDAALKGDHPYDVSKSCTDLICYTYSHTYGVPVSVTRCGNIYGGGDTHFSRIVPDAMRCLLQDKTLLIRSDGKFTRDYVYVEDIVNGYTMLAEQLKKKKLAGEAFNFSDENPMTVLEFIRLMEKVAGKKLKYKILDQAKYEIKHQYLDSKKSRKVLGWKPRFTLEQGLSRAIDWYGRNVSRG
jgi:CDP-glucose 4,6-dehydratase